MKRINILLFVLITISLFSCDKGFIDSCENGRQGVLKNLTGLDGCGWMIQLSDTERLQPSNLLEFDIELIDNKPVCVQYRELDNIMNTCMAGQMVEIISIK